MKISLTTGKVIDVPIDKYLDFNEEEYEDFIQKMISADAGIDIQDPFADIPITSELVSEYYEEQIEELPEEIIEEIIKEVKKD